MKNIYNYKIVELEKYFTKPYRATQLYEWLYKRRIISFEQITNINKKDLDFIKTQFIIEPLKIIKIEESCNSYKLLFQLKDNKQIETVLMEQPYGNSLCLSTQVGCLMGCKFCQSGQLKKIRDLEPSEMVGQILETERKLNLKISHIVLMGIGEPFDNYNNVMKFIEIINHPQGINIGARHITISTCGIVPKIEEFSNESKQVNLAISLHASNDQIRSKLMPINKVYNIKLLLNAIKNYIAKTNRRVTIEYIMLKGINDKIEHANELVKLLKGLNCYVNLIPYNETNLKGVMRSEQKDILSFYDILKQNKINVTIRKEIGTNISAACGQLQVQNKEEK